MSGPEPTRVVPINDDARHQLERRKAEPVPGVVAELEKALDRARSGALRSVLITAAYREPDGSEGDELWGCTDGATRSDMKSLLAGLALHQAGVVNALGTD